ncbi:hypothetical protein [Novosphingobium aquae]|jgi:hypothetical protein|uniref:Uncharacterized protein n=1 Tax=Novosphingobium aquae TaxID=3133435 RepID=A0ABU8S557_9SPHN
MGFPVKRLLGLSQSLRAIHPQSLRGGTSSASRPAPEHECSAMPDRKSSGFEQVDAGMTSLSPFCQALRPTARATLTVLESQCDARNFSPRLDYPAVATRPSGQPARAFRQRGNTHIAMTNTAGSSCSTGHGVFAYGRAALLPMEVRRRAWSNTNDNAHAYRCAPPGRDPGGGAKGEQD